MSNENIRAEIITVLTDEGIFERLATLENQVGTEMNAEMRAHSDNMTRKGWKVIIWMAVLGFMIQAANFVWTIAHTTMK